MSQRQAMTSTLQLWWPTWRTQEKDWSSMWMLRSKNTATAQERPSGRTTRSCRSALIKVSKLSTALHRCLYIPLLIYNGCSHSRHTRIWPNWSLLLVTYVTNSVVTAWWDQTQFQDFAQGQLIQHTGDESQNRKQATRTKNHTGFTNGLSSGIPNKGTQREARQEGLNRGVDRCKGLTYCKSVTH